MTNWEMVARLLLAASLGSGIGIERERLAWTAGLHTHMLVSVGACLIILVSTYGFSDTLGEHVVLDPIILRNEVVKGLTTAASLWTVAGMGWRPARACTWPLSPPRRSSWSFSLD
jgi:putative Mg2+ transporter-C (MgtC) family protein